MERKPRKKPPISGKPTTTSGETKTPVRTKKDIINIVIPRPTKEKFLTENQRIYYENLTKNQITICSGPAGVGKS